MWKVLWKKETKGKINKHETRSQKTCIVEWTNKLVPQSQFPCLHSEGLGLDVHQSFLQLFKPLIIRIHDSSHCAGGGLGYLCGSSIGLCFLFFFPPIVGFYTYCIIRFPSSVQRKVKV